MNPRPVEIQSTDGVRVTAHDYGGEGPPIIFCHAPGFHGRYWDLVCAALWENFHCVSLDFRGHGNTQTPTGTSMHWSGMGEDLLAVVDHFNFEKVFGVGHSMGGTSLLLAERKRQQTFESLWLFEPIVIPSGPLAEKLSRGNDLAVSARKRREQFPSREQAYLRYSSRPPFSSVNSDALRSYVDYAFADQEGGGVILKCRGETEAQVFENSATGLFDSLPSVMAVSKVVGSSDQEGPALIAPDIARALPNSTYELFSGLTHFAPMEDPERVAESIRRFFN
ncbi:MAG: alpha/beta hydrolase [Actinomycetota bacterium]|nr:alpha/beta hydrolase [Actinomycetota bacterium]